MPYEIGQIIARGGFDVAITTDPYSMAGDEWQDGIDENGKTVMVPTPENVARRVEKSRADHDELQAGYRRLREMQNN